MNKCTCSDSNLGRKHLEECPAMVCEHCGGSVNEIMPEEKNCNHLYYPENCEVCRNPRDKGICVSETSVYDVYPEMKTDSLIALWNRCNFFLRNCAEKRGGAVYWIELKEHLAHDYGWEAQAVLYIGDLENGKELIYKAWGLEAHEAMLVLFDNLKRDIPVEE